MVVADQETVSVLGNNWVNLSGSNLRAMGCGCDRAFEQIWIDSAVRELAESRRLLTAAGFQAVAHLSPSIKKRGDGDIQRITTSCLLHWRG
jgi:hypothetical protein